MYCPSCAAMNNDDAKFCRGCGANLSLVPQALTGQMPGARSERGHKHAKREKGPSMGEGIQKVSMGVAFLLISFILAVVGGGRGWWFWLLIPSFALLGSGVASIVTAKLSLRSGASQAAMPPAPSPAEMPPHTTGPIVPPPSVTEGTTRHLDAASDSYKR